MSPICRFYSFKLFLTENAAARTNALRKQQELVDFGWGVNVTKYGDIYELEVIDLDQWYFATPDKVFKFEWPMSTVLATAKYAVEFARALGKPFPAGEQIIAKNGRASLAYAEQILKGEFPAGEKAIATDYYLAHDYAILINRRFIAGEKAILETKNAYNCYWYAVDLQTRFPPGEELIAKSAEYARKYAENVLKGPFPAGEAAIAFEAEHACFYAIDVLNGPFPAGEEAIKKSPKHKTIYEKFLAEK